MTGQPGGDSTFKDLTAAGGAGGESDFLDRA